MVLDLRLLSIAVLVLSTLSLSNVVLAQATKPAQRSIAKPQSISLRKPSQAATGSTAAVPQMVRKKATKSRSSSFYYVSGSYFSFADQVFAKLGAQKIRTRTIFTGYSLGTDYTLYMSRFIYTWNLNLLYGHVDIARVLGRTYPRKPFWGVQSGPEIGYRVNSDLDLSYGVNILYRDLNSIGASLGLANQLNMKFRFTPRLTFFQSLGNYGTPTSYSYSIGLRWLL